MAIIIPHEARLRNAFAAKGLDSMSSLPDLCLNPVVQEVVLKDANCDGFKANELLQAVVLTPDEWTPESGLVTAAQKIQRAKIAKTLAADRQCTCLIILCLVVYSCALLTTSEREQYVYASLEHRLFVQKNFFFVSRTGISYSLAHIPSLCSGLFFVTLMFFSCLHALFTLYLVIFFFPYLLVRD